MKILIVNGYPKTTQGINAFADFQYLIQKVILHSFLQSPTPHPLFHFLLTIPSPPLPPPSVPCSSFLELPFPLYYLVSI